MPHRIIEKYKLDVSGKMPLRIHKSRWKEFPKLLKELGYETGVEIGVHKGRYLKALCNQGFQMFGVDAWTDYETYRDYEGMDYSLFEKEARDRLSKYKNCKLLKGWSVEAANTFGDESLDFVYIDGNHALEYVIEDIAIWSKKVRVGGIIAGHDYFRGKSKNLMHVKDAVNTWTYAYKISPWFVFDGDKCPTWFWIKEK